MATIHPNSPSDSEPRIIKVQLIISGAVIFCTTLAVVFLSIALNRANDDYQKVQSIDKIEVRLQEMVAEVRDMSRQNEELRKQNEVLKAQNVWSKDDRANLHEEQGATRESLKAQKDSLDRLEKTTGFLKDIVDQAVARDAAKQKAKDEATKKP